MNLSTLRNKVGSAWLAFSFLVVSMLTTGAAMAQTGTGATASAAITAAEGEVNLVIAAMVGVLVILVAWTLIRKAFGK